MFIKWLLLQFLWTSGILGASVAPTVVPTTCSATAKLLIGQWYDAGTVSVSVSSTQGITWTWTPPAGCGAACRLCKVDFWAGASTATPPSSGGNYAPGQFPFSETYSDCLTTFKSVTISPADVAAKFGIALTSGLNCNTVSSINWAFHAEAASDTHTSVTTGWCAKKDTGAWGSYGSASCSCDCTSWPTSWSTCDQTTCTQTRTCSNPAGAGTQIQNCPGCIIEGKTCSSWSSFSDCVQTTAGVCSKEQRCLDAGSTDVNTVACTCSSNAQCTKHTDCKWDQECKSGSCVACSSVYKNCCVNTKRCQDSSCVNALGLPNTVNINVPNSDGLTCPAISECAGGTTSSSVHCYSRAVCPTTKPNCQYGGEYCLQDGNSNNFKICNEAACPANLWQSWAACDGSKKKRSCASGSSPCKTLEKDCSGEAADNPCGTNVWSDWVSSVQKEDCTQTRTCTNSATGQLLSEDQPCECTTWGTTTACTKHSQETPCNDPDKKGWTVSERCSATTETCSSHDDCRWNQYCKSGTCTSCPTENMIGKCCDISGRCQSSSCTALGFPNSARANVNKKDAVTLNIRCPAIENCAFSQGSLHCFNHVACISGEKCFAKGEYCLQDGNSENFKVCTNGCGVWSSWGPCVSSGGCCRKKRTCADADLNEITGNAYKRARKSLVEYMDCPPVDGVSQCPANAPIQCDKIIGTLPSSWAQQPLSVEKDEIGVDLEWQMLVAGATGTLSGSCTISADKNDLLSLNGLSTGTSAVTQGPCTDSGCKFWLATNYFSPLANKYATATYTVRCTITDSGTSSDATCTQDVVFAAPPKCISVNPISITNTLTLTPWVVQTVADPTDASVTLTWLVNAITPAAKGWNWDLSTCKVYYDNSVVATGTRDATDGSWTASFVPNGDLWPSTCDEQQISGYSVECLLTDADGHTTSSSSDTCQDSFTVTDATLPVCINMTTVDPKETDSEGKVTLEWTVKGSDNDAISEHQSKCVVKANNTVVKTVALDACTSGAQGYACTAILTSDDVTSDTIDKTWSIVCTLKDTAGNTADAPATNCAGTVVIEDNTNPKCTSVTITTDPITTNDPDGDVTVEWTVEATDNIGVDWTKTTCKVKLNGVEKATGTHDACTGGSCGFSATFQPTTSTGYSVECTIKDAADNVASSECVCTAPLTIQDGTTPECNTLTTTSPQDWTHVETDSEGKVTIAWTLEADDNFGVSWGDSKCKVTHSTTGNVEVTDKDSLVPISVCSGTGPCQYSVTFTPTVVGTHHLTCEVSDGTNTANAGPCVHDFTVVDKTPPECAPLGALNSPTTFEQCKTSGYRVDIIGDTLNVEQRLASNSVSLTWHVAAGSAATSAVCTISTGFAFIPIPTTCSTPDCVSSSTTPATCLASGATSCFTFTHTFDSSAKVKCVVRQDTTPVPVAAIKLDVPSTDCKEVLLLSTDAQTGLVGLNWTFGGTDNIGIDWADSYCEVQLNGMSMRDSALCTGSAPMTCQTSFPPVAVEDYRVVCVLKDTAGNIAMNAACSGDSDSCSLPFKIADTTPPVCNGVTPKLPVTTVPWVDVEIGSTGTVSLSWEVGATDNIGIEWDQVTCEVVYQAPGAATAASLSPKVKTNGGSECSSSSHTCTLSLSFTPVHITGYSIQCSVVDVGGNQAASQCSQPVTFKDVTPPSCQGISPSGPTVDLARLNTTSTGSVTVQWILAANDSFGINWDNTSCVVSNKSASATTGVDITPTLLGPCTDAAGCEYTATFLPVASTVYDIICTVYDRNGNSVQCSEDLTIKDKAPPRCTGISVTGTDKWVMDLKDGQTTTNWEFAVSGVDNFAVSSAKCVVSNTGSTPAISPPLPALTNVTCKPLAPGSLETQCVVAPTADLPLGTYQIDCAVNDAAGNGPVTDATACSHALTVTDCPDTPMGTALIAGQKYNAGTVQVRFDDQFIYVTYAVLYGWSISEVHLEIGTSAGVLVTAPGQMPLSQTSLASGTTFYTLNYPWSKVLTGTSPSLSSCGTGLKTFYIGAHAVVQGPSGSGIGGQTAWGSGTKFGQDWSMYFQVDLKCSCAEPSGTCPTPLESDWPLQCPVPCGWGIQAVKKDCPYEKYRECNAGDCTAICSGATSKTVGFQYGTTAASTTNGRVELNWDGRVFSVTTLAPSSYTFTNIQVWATTTKPDIDNGSTLNSITDPAKQVLTSSGKSVERFFKWGNDFVPQCWAPNAPESVPAYVVVQATVSKNNGSPRVQWIARTDIPLICRCPTCSDGQKNGDETSIDCGGSCGQCTCSDGKRNGDETGVDCGGSCPTSCVTSSGMSSEGDQGTNAQDTSSPVWPWITTGIVGIVVGAVVGGFGGVYYAKRALGFSELQFTIHSDDNVVHAPAPSSVISPMYGGFPPKADDATHPMPTTTPNRVVTPKAFTPRSAV